MLFRLTPEKKVRDRFGSWAFSSIHWAWTWFCKARSHVKTLPMSEKATLPAYWLSRPGAHEQCHGGPLLKSLGNFVHDEGVWLKYH